MLRDKRFLPHFKKSLESKRDDLPARPDLTGYSREVQEIHKLHITMTHLLRATTRNQGIPMPAAPLYPGEMIQIEAAKQELADLDSDITSAMGGG